MSHELFYTSAPKGLQPGSRGFCAVASTEGLPGHLAEKVESLSAYRPLYPPLDARAHLNPVVHSHLRVTVGGKTYSVLSRISPSGLDYSQRSNKFAHHVILEPGELPPGGPAWLLAQPGFLENRWDGEVRFLPTGRIPPQGDSEPGVCRHWQSLTGDAGWAGVLADSLEKNPPRQMHLIFSPGMDLLPLVAEAISLVPPSKRWLVTFSTYFTGLPQGIPCLWRFVLKDSPEAAQAGRLHGQEVINLCEPLGKPAPSELVQAARTGRRSANAAALTERLEPANDWPTKGGRTFQIKEPISAKTNSPRRDSNDIDPTRPASAKGSPQPRIIRPPPPQTAKHKRSWIWAALVVGLILGLVAGIAASLLVLNRNWKESVANQAASDEQEKPAVSAKEKEAGEKDPAKKVPRAPAVEKDKDVAQPAEKTKEPDKTKEKSKNTDNDLDVQKKRLVQLQTELNELKTKKEKAEKDKLAVQKQLDDLKSKLISPTLPRVNKYFPLPRTNSINSKENQVEVELKKWGLAASDYTLALLGADDSLEPRPNRMTGSLNVGRKDQKEDLASFKIIDGKLHFEWFTLPRRQPKDADDLSRSQHLLRECILEIKGGNKPFHVALREPSKPKIEPVLPFTSVAPQEFIDDIAQGCPSRTLFLESMEIDLEGQSIVQSEEYLGIKALPRIFPIEKPNPPEPENEPKGGTARWILLDKSSSKDNIASLRIGSPSGPLKVKVRSLVIYMEVAGFYVEVARIGARVH